MTTTPYSVNGINASIMPGTIIPYIGSIAPRGWSLCDGSSYDNSINPLLNYAIGNPSIKKLPNLGAAFLRGSGISPIDASYNGETVRTFQNDTIKLHNHNITEREHSHGYEKNGTTRANAANRLGGVPSLVPTHETTISYTGVTINSIGDDETRPYCYGINYIIKMDV